MPAPPRTATYSARPFTGPAPDSQSMKDAQAAQAVYAAADLAASGALDFPDTPMPPEWAQRLANAARGQALSVWVAAGESEKDAAARNAQGEGAHAAQTVAQKALSAASPRALFLWLRTRENGVQSRDFSPLSHSGAMAREEILGVLCDLLFNNPPSPGQAPPYAPSASSILGDRVLGRSTPETRALARELCERHGFSHVCVDAACAETPERQKAVLKAVLKAAGRASRHWGLPEKTLGLNGQLALMLRSDRPRARGAIHAANAYFQLSEGDSQLMPSSASAGGPTSARAPYLGFIALKPSRDTLSGNALSDSLEGPLVHEWTHALDFLIARRSAPKTRELFSQLSPDDRARINPLAAAGLQKIERAIFQRSAVANDPRAALEEARLGQEQLRSIARSLRQTLAGALSGAHSMVVRSQDLAICAQWVAASLRHASPERVQRHTQSLFEMGLAEGDFPEVDPTLLEAARRVMRSRPLRGDPRAAEKVGRAFANLAPELGRFATRQLFGHAPQPSAGLFATARSYGDGLRGRHYGMAAHELLASAIGRPLNAKTLIRSALDTPADTPLFTPSEQRDVREGFALFAQGAGLSIEPARALGPGCMEAFAALAQRAGLLGLKAQREFRPLMRAPANRLLASTDAGVAFLEKMAAHRRERATQPSAETAFSSPASGPGTPSGR